MHALERAPTSAQRVEAIQDLVRAVMIDGSVVVPPLIRSLADPEPAVRVEAARSLGPAASAAAMTTSAGDHVTAAIAAVNRSLDDPVPAVRIAAVQTLGAIAASRNPSGVIDPRVLIDSLSTMLNDPDATVRAAAIASLGLAGSVAGLNPPPALIAALNDDSSFNRAAAAHALARFSSRPTD